MHVTLQQQSDLPCPQLTDSLMIPSSPSIEQTRSQLTRSQMKRSAGSSSSTAARDETNTYDFQVRTKTADKSLRGQSGHDVNVYLNIYDAANKQLGDSQCLENSANHKTPFQRHHVDQFNVTLPRVNMCDIHRIDLYHDGQNDG